MIHQDELLESGATKESSCEVQIQALDQMSLEMPSGIEKKC